MALSYTIPGKQVGVYSVHKHKLATFFIWKSDPLQYSNIEEKKNLLRKAFKDVKWFTPELLVALDQTPEFYFDSVSQVVLDTWYDNRVSLVGDASHSVSLIAGEGAGLSMAGAYTLAGELNQWKADHQTAFENYQNIMKPEILRKQKFAQSFAKSFVPDSKLGIWSRDIVTKFMFIPGLSERLIKRFLTDELELKKY
jgi:2-polyprenyl-6-methoxyphenol hydroxylase-like FAD-dependent oxidoreductase